MHWRHTEASIGAGEVVFGEFLVSIGDDRSAAESAWNDNRDVYCDADHDGVPRVRRFGMIGWIDRQENALREGGGRQAPETRGN